MTDQDMCGRLKKMFPEIALPVHEKELGDLSCSQMQRPQLGKVQGNSKVIISHLHFHNITSYSDTQSLH